MADQLWLMTRIREEELCKMCPSVPILALLVLIAVIVAAQFRLFPSVCFASQKLGLYQFVSGHDV